MIANKFMNNIKRPNPIHFLNKQELAFFDTSGNLMTFLLTLRTKKDYVGVFF